MIACTQECGRQADVHCRYERLNYCQKCSDARHQKNAFKEHTIVPLCEMCEEAPAAYDCSSCGPVKLCVGCDTSEHRKSARSQQNHKRRSLSAPTTLPKTPLRRPPVAKMPATPRKPPVKARFPLHQPELTPEHHMMLKTFACLHVQDESD